MSSKNKKAAKSTIKVYCGPTIPNVCNRYSMFSVVPEALDSKAKEVPLIKNLILPITKLRDARIQIESKSGPYYAIYLEIKKSL